MFEFIVVLLIAAAGWFYWRNKNNDIEDSSSISEADQRPATPQPEPSIEKPEFTAAEPVKTEPVVTKQSEAVNEIPEDSALRRHYLHNQAAQDQKYVDPGATADAKDSVVEPAKPVITKTEIPVEKEVKRDVIQQLVAETEATMPPRPTDSTLKRHYDTQLMSIVLTKLQESK